MDWNSDYVGDLIRVALREDTGTSDAAALAIIPSGVVGRGRIVVGQDVAVAGLPLVVKVFGALDPGMEMEPISEDGTFLKVGKDLLRIRGKAAAILSGERTALNFLGRLSGIASLTRKFVERIEGTRAKILHARKTTPGLRVLEEYAVRMGGGTTHCTGTHHAFLLSGPPIAMAGGIKPALDRAHAYAALRMQPRAMTAYEAVSSAPTPEEEASSLSIQI
jgi:nicotinate-nucleotide pyrophosphorylase (carboxylating)